MSDTITYTLNDIAHAIHDSLNRFNKPLQPCAKDTTAIMKAEKIGIREAWEKAPKVPREIHSGELDGVELFQQTWGSTALGFGGWGGSAMTTANVVIVFYHGEACVYFGSRFAYKVRRSAELTNDIAKRQLADVCDCGKYAQ